MYSFRKISGIEVDDDSTWTDSIFLTFDIDWVVDDVYNDTIDLVEMADVSATLFVTHNTLVLDRLRANPKLELGIHPNFNFLLEGDNRNGHNAREVIRLLQAIVPEATSVRSHSMTQSARLMDLFNQMGLTHDVNDFIPVHTGIKLSPWLLWNDLIRIPYLWSDDAHCLYNLEEEITVLADGPGLKVFDFHPIHVFLNTESMDRYERTRPLHRKPKELIKHRYEGYGTRSRLIELLELSKQP
jgi:hypothetical protein